MRSAATGPRCRHVQTVAKVSRLLPPDAFERRCNDQSGRQSIQRLCVRLLPRQAEAHLSNRAIIDLGSSSGAANRTFLSALDTGDRHPQKHCYGTGRCEVVKRGSLADSWIRNPFASSSSQSMLAREIMALSWLNRLSRGFLHTYTRLKNYAASSSLIESWS